MAGKQLRTRQFSRKNSSTPYYKEHYNRSSRLNTSQGDDDYHNEYSNYLDHRQLTDELPNRNHNEHLKYRNRNHGNLKNSSLILKRSKTGWYNIHIPNIKNYDKIIKMILAYISPVVFYPYNKQYIKNALTFLVDDYKIANILHNANCKLILMDNNQKLIIRVFSYLPSHLTISFKPVSEKVKEKIKEAMITRYDSSTNYLDLSKFHTCPLFTENKLFVPLNQPAVFLAALNIIAKHTNHNLYGLSLEKNNIYLNEGLVFIRRLFPELKVLNLADNLLTDFKSLWSLTGYTIDVLNLSSNPISNSNDKEFYRLNVQKLFPMLKKLDNLELPFRYSNFIIDSKLKMPINLGNSYPILNNHDSEQLNPVATLVESFITQYYERYDNKVSKQIVVDAYCENATFSMSADYLSNKSRSINNLAKYSKYSRNFLKNYQNKFKTNNLEYKGRENIINFLEKLPKTKHDFGSFVIDVPLANSALVQITVNGVFNEIDNKSVFQSFCRIFCIVPIGEGWRILNDMLFMTLVSDELLVESSKRFYVYNHEPEKLKMDDHNSNNNVTKYMDADKDESSSYKLSPILSKYENNFQESVIENQQKTYQKQNQPMAKVVFSPNKLFSTVKPTGTVYPATMHTNQSIPVELSKSINNTDINIESKKSMVKKFSIESGMNVEWSKKCLEDNGWNYEKSSLCFTKLKSCIPSIAYIHSCD